MRVSHASKVITAFVFAILFIGLNQVQAGSVYNDAVIADNPLLYWTFDEANGNAISQVNNMPSNELTPQNGATRAPSTSTGGGISLGSAASFNGGASQNFFAADLFAPAVGAGGDFIATQIWAVEFWFKPTATTAQYISETFNPGSNNPGIIYGFNGNPANSPELELFSGGNRTGAGPAVVNQWHHVVMAFYGNSGGFADNLREIYVDGVVTQDTTSAFSTGHGLGAIGIGGTAFNASNSFNGLIDEYAIYEIGTTTDPDPATQFALRKARVADIVDHRNLAIPEPNTLVLTLLALFGLVGNQLRRLRKR